jgi:hypothetical protein
VAWTEATTRCANYFGVTESQLPAVLIMSFWETAAVLIVNSAQLPLYKFSKGIIEALGDQPRLLREAIEKRDRLQRTLQVGEREQQVRQGRRDARIDQWNKTVQEFDETLQKLSATLDPGLLARCRESLHSGDHATLLPRVKELHQQLSLVPPDQRPVSRNTIWRFAEILKNDEPPHVHDSDEFDFADQLRRWSRDLEDARVNAETRRRNLGLVNAVIEAGSAVHFTPRDASDGQAALAGWAVHAIGPATGDPEPSVVSGIFISYRRQDEQSFAGRLYDRLSSFFDERQIFMDVDSIEPGLDFKQVIEERLAVCSVVLVIIGKAWVDCIEGDGSRRLDNPGDFVRLEVEAALARADVRVIPVLVNGAPVPEAAKLPLSLRPLVSRNAFMMTHERFGSDFGRLFSVLAPGSSSRTRAAWLPPDR